MRLTIKFVACAGLAIAVAAVSVPVQAGPAETIKERRALMKKNSKSVKGIVGYLKKGQGSATDVVKHAELIAANAAKIAGLFPKGTGMNDGVGETGAKPAIWTEQGKFGAAANNLKTLASALAKTARSGDKKAIGMAMSSFGKQGCGGCHRTFRQKLKKK